MAFRQSRSKIAKKSAEWCSTFNRWWIFWISGESIRHSQRKPVQPLLRNLISQLAESLTAIFNCAQINHFQIDRESIPKSSCQATWCLSCSPPFVSTAFIFVFDWSLIFFDFASTDPAVSSIVARFFREHSFFDDIFVQAIILHNFKITKIVTTLWNDNLFSMWLLLDMQILRFVHFIPSPRPPFTQTLHMRAKETTHY